MRKIELLGLTGIRFYAALTVYITHAVEKLPGTDALMGSSVILQAGSNAVSFFFVLSGFILAYNYADHFRGGVSLSRYKRFVWDRLARIYPVHLLTLLLVVPIAMLSPNNPLDWRAFPFHLTLLQCWWPSSSPLWFSYFNTPSWSISCEWFFYVLAPLAIFLSLRNSRKWVPLTLTLVYVFGIGWFLGYSQPDRTRTHFVNFFAPSRFAEFLAGVYVARLFLASPEGKLSWASRGMQVSGVLFIVLGAISKQFSIWPFRGGLLIIPGAALLILGLAYGHGQFVAHLSRPWLNRLGVASFSLYMVHDPILRAVRGTFFYSGWEVRSWPMFLAIGLVVFLLVQTAALMVCYGFEIPMQKRLRSMLNA